MAIVVRRAIIVILGLSAAAGLAWADAVKLRVKPAIYVDGKGSSIKAPEAVAFDGRSALAIADTGHGRLLLYSVTGDEIVPEREIDVDELPYPIRVRFGPGGELFALDGRSRKIVRLSPDGEFSRFVDLAAVAGGGAVVPRSFDVGRDGSLYVLDVSGGRVVVMNPSGGVERQIAFGEQCKFLSDIAVNEAGTVFAIDSVGRRVFVGRKGELALTPLTDPLDADLEFSTAIAADELGNIYLADQGEGGIVILGQNGSFEGRQARQGWKEGFLRYPSGISAAGGYVFVADRGNNRVQVFVVAR